MPRDCTQRDGETVSPDPLRGCGGSGQACRARLRSASQNDQPEHPEPDRGSPVGQYVQTVTEKNTEVVRR